MIDAVVVNHNTSLFTELLIRSLKATHNRSLEIALTVLDNDSSDDMTSLRDCCAQYDIPLLPSGLTTKTKRNSHEEILTRFVLQRPASSHYLFLDADVCFLEPNTVGQMLIHLKNDPDLFAVGVRQSWDGVEEVPEDSRPGLYRNRVHPCCALIRNSEIFQCVVQSVGLAGVTYHGNTSEQYWDTCELATRVMKTHGFRHEICRAMVLHFFNVSYNPQWLQRKLALRDRMLERFRQRRKTSVPPESEKRNLTYHGNGIEEPTSMLNPGLAGNDERAPSR
jgi:hypothetical protein